jgi:hypothetical protein
MLKNRKIQMLGVIVLIAFAVLVTISAVEAPVSDINSATRSSVPGASAYEANQIGLAIYHASERMQPVNWTKSSDPLFQYHQSEWFGK